LSGFPIEPEERVGISVEGTRERLVGSVRNAYDQRLQLVGDETFREIEKAILLHTVDTSWQEHLYAMDELKEGVGFVGIGGKNPLIEYKKGAFEMFESLIARIDSETMQNLFRLRIDSEAPEFGSPMRGGRYSSIHREAPDLGFQGAAPGGGPPEGDQPEIGMLGRPAAAPRGRGLVAAGSEGTDSAKRAPVRTGPKVGRNSPCPCGSGKKFKHCHGRA
jgi:preprotein translocase subunit SecA